MVVNSETETHFFLAQFLNSQSEHMNQKRQVFEFLIQGALRELIQMTACQIWSNHSGNKVS